MFFIHGSSKLSKEELLSILKEHDALLLNPKKINSTEELFLAERLTKDAFMEKRNIAKREENELLLWIAAGTNISSSLKEYSFHSPKNIIIISFANTKQELKNLFQIEEKPLNLKKKATPLEVERISLSRIF